MRILVLTSCTGVKAVTHPRPLTQRDFRQGPAHVAERERQLAELLRPAEELYTGQQHARLMRGTHALRKRAAVEVFILSAGYGIVSGRQPLAPYECTFTGMSATALRRWAETLGVPQRVRSLLAEPYDLRLVLLGDTYLKACGLGPDLRLAGPTVFLCGTAAARQLPVAPGLRAVPLAPADAARFHCGLVGLKGEVAARWLDWLAHDPDNLRHFSDPATDLLAPIDGTGETARRPNPTVDCVIDLSESWRRRAQQTRLRYFIPEWDDLVDPDYDFLRDRHSHGRGHWSNHVYAHQLYPEPNYDGILISRLVAEQSRDKRERINQLGVHRFLRVPPEFPIMGDCGAFGYIDQETPPYETGEILDYYSRLGFDYGVSIDHLIVASTESRRRQRYDLTIQNAADFLGGHRKRRLAWEPIGAVQGWDGASYAAAARKYVKMGYRYLGLGGLVRSGTAQILEIVQAVHDVIPTETRVHLFGLARFDAIRAFADLGVTSLDSASALRRAWLGSELNYLTPGGWYSAIRVPQSDGCFRAKRLMDRGERSAAQLRRLEAECLAGLRRLNAVRLSTALLDRLAEYDTLLAGPRPGTRDRIRRTLEDRPWEKCGCAICARWGIEVAIFRGNNRNRRRGFHNTHVFYRLIDRLLAGERIGWIEANRGIKPDG